MNFGSRSDARWTGEKAANKRSEMWLAARDWLERGSLPRDDMLAAELSAPSYRYNARDAIVLESKEDMKKRGVPSPDLADAFALTFAYPVMPADPEEESGRRFDPFSARSTVTGY